MVDEPGSEEAQPAPAGPGEGDIGLALSGGGFRASLFHVGVLRYLRDAQLIGRVTHVCSVSGGSVVAAHLALNWERYAGTAEQFEDAASELVSLVRKGLRLRILQRLPWLYPFRFVFNNPVSRYVGLGKIYDWRFPNGSLRIELLARYLSKLCGHAHLADLSVEGRTGPEIFILASNASEGTLAAFTRTGIMASLAEPTPGATTYELKVSRSTRPRVGLAVAASAALPGVVPPVRITNERLGLSEKEGFSGGVRFFSDGGIMDNSGTMMFRCLFAGARTADPPDLGRVPRRILVSDASLPLDYATSPEIGAVASAFRSSEILVRRIAALERKVSESRAWRPADVPALAFVDISDTDPQQTELSRDIQNRMPFVRTDLDAFSPLEINTLCAHGYAIARKQMESKPHRAKFSVTPLPSDKRMRWKPGGGSRDDASYKEGRSAVKAAKALDGSMRRKIFSGVLRDGFSIVNGLVLAGLVVLLLIAFRAVGPSRVDYDFDFELDYDNQYHLSWKDALSAFRARKVEWFEARSKLLDGASALPEGELEYLRQLRHVLLGSLLEEQHGLAAFMDHKSADDRYDVVPAHIAALKAGAKSADAKHEKTLRELLKRLLKPDDDFEVPVLPEVDPMTSLEFWVDVRNEHIRAGIRRRVKEDLLMQPTGLVPPGASEPIPADVQDGYALLESERALFREYVETKLMAGEQVKGSANFVTEEVEDAPHAIHGSASLPDAAGLLQSDGSAYVHSLTFEVSGTWDKDADVIDFRLLEDRSSGLRIYLAKLEWKEKEQHYGGTLETASGVEVGYVKLTLR